MSDTTIQSTHHASDMLMVTFRFEREHVECATVSMPPHRWWRAYQLLLEDDVTRDVMTDKKD